MYHTRTHKSRLSLRLDHIYKRIAKKLHYKLINQACEINGNKLTVSASIGFTCYPGHSESSKQLIDMADTAMYHAKTSKVGWMRFNENLKPHTH